MLPGHTPGAMAGSYREREGRGKPISELKWDTLVRTTGAGDGMGQCQAGGAPSVMTDAGTTKTGRSESASRGAEACHAVKSASDSQSSDKRGEGSSNTSFPIYSEHRHQVDQDIS